MTGIEAWQISIVVTAVVVLVEFAVNLLLNHWKRPAMSGAWRTALLAILLLLTMVVFVAALGTTRADELSSVAAGVSAVAALWLTHRSYQANKEARLAATSTPEPPTQEAPEPPTPTEPPQPVEPSNTQPPVTIPPPRSWLRSGRKARRRG